MYITSTHEVELPINFLFLQQITGQRRPSGERQLVLGVVDTLKEFTDDLRMVSNLLYQLLQKRPKSKLLQLPKAKLKPKLTNTS